MTCILGLVDSDKVWLGGDSRGTSGTDIRDSENEKVWRANLHGEKILFGAAGQRSVNQFIRHCVPLPSRAFDERKETFVEYFIREWVRTLRDALVKQNIGKIKDGVVDTGGHVLIGRKKKLYIVDSHLSFTELATPIIGIGSGGNFGQGVLWAFRHLKSEMKPETKIRTAIRASTEYCNGVGGRIDVLSV